MGETTMPCAVGEHSRLCWLGGFPSDGFQGGNGAPVVDISVADCSESLELAVGDGRCDDVAVLENIRSSGPMHADFEAILDEDVAGDEIRVHLGNMKYILHFHNLVIAASIYDGDVDRADANSVEPSLCRLDVDRLLETEVVAVEVAVRREMLCGA